jgi:N-acetylmuramic acid 6-phosphate etherase
MLVDELGLDYEPAKLIDRGTRMLVDELGLDYEPAKRLLEMHGSVKKVLEMNKK